MFPFRGFTPAIGVGIVSIVILAVALIALYSKHLVGSWRWIYVATAAAAHRGAGLRKRKKPPVTAASANPGRVGTLT